MKFKRFLSILLILCSLLTLLPVGALPVDAIESQVGIHRGSIPFQPNPLYEDLVDSSTQENFADAQPIKTYGSVTHLSFNAAAKELREAMVERATLLEIHYKVTTDVEDSIYDLIDAAMVHTGNPKEGDYLLYTFAGWKANYMYKYEDGAYYISASYTLSYYTTADQETEMDKAVDNLLSQLALTNKTDYQKIYSIYDYITTNVRYDYTNLNDNSYLLKYTGYAALVNKTSVCQGYANLFYRLALEAGIDARIIAGDGGGPHSWNIVQLDGSYYNLDATWDEGQGYWYWFLCSPDDFYNHYRYAEYDTSAFHKAYPMAATSYQYDAVTSNIQIDTQPKNVTVAEGATAKITVKARGIGLTYQWYYKDVGQSSFSKSSVKKATYSATVNASVNGRKLYCLIKDADGNQLKTKTVTISMTSPAKIVTQPTNAVAPKGSKATVKIAATGDGLTYKWYYKNAGSSKFSLTTAFTGDSYSIAMDASRNGRQVYCVVTDKYGNSVKSNTATLYMGNPAKITSLSTNATVPSGTTATIKLNATGDGLTYRWYFKNKGTTKFSLSSSFTKNTYSVAMDSTRNGRQVYCVITDKYGNSVRSETVTLIMCSPAKITTQPTNATAPKGSTATVKLSAKGEGLTYKWYYKNKGATKFSLTTSFTGNTYSIKMDASRNGRQVYCVVTDKFGNSVKSKTATLYMGNPAKITTQPRNATAPTGKTATVKLAATGDGLSYKWYFKNKGSSNFSLTTAFTGNTYSINMDSARNGRQVYCVVTDKYGNSVKSNTVTLYAGNPAKITTQPSSVSVASGKTATVKLAATGDGLSYQWFFKNKGGSSFSLTTSFTGSTYSIKMDSARNGRQVYCVITDKYGNSVKSNTVTLSIK